METHDQRIVHARQFLADARRRDPAELALDELIREDAELRRYLGGAIGVADDWAATDRDDDVTKVVSCGGVYVAPADVLTLCGGCLSRLVGDQQRPPSGTGDQQASYAA
jgi:hypothetical protein